MVRARRAARVSGTQFLCNGQGRGDHVQEVALSQNKRGIYIRGKIKFVVDVIEDALAGVALLNIFHARPPDLLPVVVQ